MSNKTSNPMSNLLTSDLFDIREEAVNGSADGYVAGEIVTFKDGKYDKATLKSGDDHTEAFAVVYSDIGANDTKGAILVLGGVNEDLLSQAYKDLSDDDKNLVKAELNAKKIFIEKI